MKVIMITAWMLFLAVWDIKCRKLPLSLLGVGMAYGVFAFALMIAEKGIISFPALLGAVGAGVLLVALAFLTGMVGYADGVVVIVIGLLAGYRHVMATLCMALLLASVYSAGLLIFRKAKRNTQIPFLPFLLTGWMFAIFLCGGELW
ncbi:MAG: prepilin peptidase [Acetatifactor sp.]